MSIRASQLYISRETRRCLSCIAKAEGNDSTADSVGERLLSEKLRMQFPALVLLQREIDDIEKKMVESVKVNL